MENDISIYRDRVSKYVREVNPEEQESQEKVLIYALADLFNLYKTSQFNGVLTRSCITIIK